MSKRAVVMTLAVVLAVGVMIAAYLVGGGAPTDQPAGPRRPSPQGPTALDPSWPAGEFNPRAGGRTPPLQAVGQTQFTRVNEQGRLEVYKGDPITPLPGGWWQVGKPEFLYHLADDRALRLRAEQGRLYAPAEPRSGELKGQVKLEYFDASVADRPVRIEDDSPDLRVRMHMQQVTFDRDLFRLETDGPFHLTSPQFDFVGQGLKLVYSDANRRIETLQVQRSQQLRFRTHSPDQPEDDSQADAPADDAQADAGTPDADAADAEAPSRRPVQFYKAVFPVNVRLQSPQAQMHCEELEIIFSLQNEAGHHRLFQSQSPGAARRPDSPVMMAALLEAGGPPLHQAMRQMMLWSMAQTPPGDELAAASQAFAGQSLLSPSPDDLVLLWDGALMVTPVTPEVALAGPQDVWVQMRGRPVRVVSDRGESTHAATLSYRVSDGQLTLLGSDAYPVVMQSAQLGGVLEARHFQLSQQDAVAQVQGAGRLRAVAQQMDADDETPVDEQVADRLPAGFVVQWQEKLDLSFYPRQDDEDGKTDPAASHDPSRRLVRLAALRDAVFHGQVQVTHPQLEVRSDQLAMTLGQPGSAGLAGSSRQAMDHIRAQGDVHVQVHGQGDGQEEASIASSELTIELGQDDQGRVAPQRLIARRDVVAITAQGTLKAGLLTAILQNGDQDNASSATQADTAAVARVIHLTPLPGAGSGETPTGDVATSASQPVAQAAGPSRGSSAVADAFDVVLEVASTPEGEEAASVTSAGASPDSASQDASASTSTSEPDAGSDSQAVSHFAQSALKQIIAEEGVDIDMGDPATRVQAHRLVADIGPLETQIEMWGLDDDQPVQVAREGLLITGPRVIFAQQARTLHMPDRGRMEFYSRAPVKLDAPADGGAANASSRTQAALAGDASAGNTSGGGGASGGGATLVVVTWGDAMHFDDRAGTAQFLGDVQAHGSQGGDSSHLACEDLRLEFLNETARAGLPGNDDASAELTESQKLLRGARQVQRVIARQDVVFEAQAMGKTPGEPLPESRVRIEGPLMTFDGLSEQVQVIGQGRMSIEDRRQRSGRPAKEGAAGRPVEAMVGQGATVFVWQERMILDAARNDMILREGVQMIHLPQGQGQPFQLDCDHLVADMASTGGLASITSAGTPQLQAIRADGRVRLLSGDRQVVTDHLFYDGLTEMVRLHGDEGRYTTISDAKTPVPLTYREVRWFLRDNRFEGIDPGRGVVPLLRDGARP